MTADEYDTLRDWWDGLREVEQFEAFVIEKSNADALAAERARYAALDVERLIDVARMATLTAKDAPHAQDVMWNKGWAAAIDALRAALEETA